MPATVREPRAGTMRPVVRIGLIGGECTGKSTLACDLAEALRERTSWPVCVVTELLRAFVADHGRPPLAPEQAAIMAAQRAAEDAAACEADIVIADPATLMTAVYSELYFDDEGLWSQAARDARDYAVLLWCRPDLPWEPDPGQRDGPAYRERADAIIASRLALDPNWPEGQSMAMAVSGSRPARLRQAVTHTIGAMAAMGVWREGEPGFRT